jgi:hypothetical protein
MRAVTDYYRRRKPTTPWGDTPPRLFTGALRNGSSTRLQCTFAALAVTPLNKRLADKRRSTFILTRSVKELRTTGLLLVPVDGALHEWRVIRPEFNIGNHYATRVDLFLRMPRRTSNASQSTLRPCGLTNADFITTAVLDLYRPTNKGLGERSRTMLIIGCDYHPSVQQLHSQVRKQEIAASTD